jgi:hypothetical protein
MQIQLQQTGTKGAFYIEENGIRLAEMTFSRAGDSLIIIDHTEVSDALRGTGAGKQLAAEAVAYARLNHLKILPLCPFAHAVFQKNTSYSDVLTGE